MLEFIIGVGLGFITGYITYGYLIYSRYRRFGYIPEWKTDTTEFWRK